MPSRKNGGFWFVICKRWSGTILDTARFRSLIGEHLGVSARSVNAYVLGEQGDPEVRSGRAPNWAGFPLADLWHHPLGAEDCRGERLGWKTLAVSLRGEYRALDRSIAQTLDRSIAQIQAAVAELEGKQSVLATRMPGRFCHAG